MTSYTDDYSEIAGNPRLAWAAALELLERIALALEDLADDD